METLGQFAGVLAHDVRTYIRAIGWAADSLAADLGADDPRHADAVQIQRAVAEAREMIASVLEFARGGRATGTTDLAAHVARIGGIIDRLAGPDVALEVDLPASLPPVALAPASVTQVLVNLATNAREAMPAGGTLRIRARELDPPEVARADAARADGAPPDAPRPPRLVRLTIADTGVGMDGATAGRVFEPFYTTRTDDGDSGTGLGLPGVYLVVTRAGGAVRLESAPGADTTFTLDLPVADGS
jgi:two-component system, cell cycle sensor histidine kinase and response regulator CckA